MSRVQILLLGLSRAVLTWRLLGKSMFHYLVKRFGICWVGVVGGWVCGCIVVSKFNHNGIVHWLTHLVAYINIQINCLRPATVCVG